MLQMRSRFPFFIFLLLDATSLVFCLYKEVLFCLQIIYFVVVKVVVNYSITMNVFTYRSQATHFSTTFYV